MDDAFLMCRRYAAGNLNGDVDRGLRRQRAGRKRLAQRLALEQLRYDVWRLADSDVEDRDDVGVVECGRRLGFLRETSEAHRLVRELGREHFDCHVATKSGSWAYRLRPSRRCRAVR